MKFTVEKDLILREVQIAQEIIASRSNMSILSNVLLHAAEGELIVRATDLKVSFETRIPVVVTEPGITTVFCDKLQGILRSLPEGEIEFEQGSAATGENFVIRPKFKEIDFRLRSIPADKFPELQTHIDSGYFDFPQADFAEMVTQTAFAVSDDETRFFMNGVYLETAEDKLIMVATDGRRLSLISHEIPEGLEHFEGVIIPPKVLNLVRRLSTGEGTLQMAIADKHIFFAFENHYISSSLIEGQFPNYRRVIPETQHYSIQLEKAVFSEALKRVALMVEKSRRIYLDISAGQIQIRSEESEVGVARESVAVDFEGPDTTIALNYMYLVDPLRVINTDTISIHFTEPNKALTIYSEPLDRYYHIVMPMQLQ
ncbi:DNA polymerase III subunit beta [Alkalispirochaeta sphaeroplastigenens]|uniref:Beta sliding clamp n=1 Tax=Alkalispirochaeta sphaeroplastigenens TaxID=1187066 RepID=A0A2S4K0S8_9SPIO|nr:MULTISPECIES: DNA polymerase III subunit beta [Alkalispirochaeta]POR05367.1 DNA polymerase III subunit beta [Alkalispirochaeta sphaeroplastigenens]